jgi:hypothetical protein
MDLCHWLHLTTPTYTRSLIPIRYAVPHSYNARIRDLLFATHIGGGHRSPDYCRNAASANVSIRQQQKLKKDCRALERLGQAMSLSVDDAERKPQEAPRRRDQSRRSYASTPVGRATHSARRGIRP